MTIKLPSSASRNSIHSRPHHKSKRQISKQGSTRTAQTTKKSPSGQLLGKAHLPKANIQKVNAAGVLAANQEKNSIDALNEIAARPSFVRFEDLPFPEGNAAFKNITFASRIEEFRDLMNPLTPHSDIKVADGNLDGKINTRGAQLLTTVTGENSKQGVGRSIEQIRDDLHPQGEFRLRKTDNYAVNLQKTFGALDLLGSASSQIDLEGGATANVGLRASKNSSVEVAIHESEDHQQDVKAKKLSTNELIGSAGVRLQAGVTAGPIELGPKVSASAELGVNYSESETATLKPEVNPSKMFLSLAQHEGLQLNTVEWENLSQQKGFSTPASAKLMATLNTNGVILDGNIQGKADGVIQAGIEIDDLGKFKETAKVYSASGIQASASPGAELEKLTDAKPSFTEAASKVARPVFDKAAESGRTSETSQPSKRIYGSHLNSLFQFGQHLSTLERMVGPGSADHAVALLREASHPNLPTENMEFNIKSGNGETIIEGRGFYTGRKGDGFDIGIIDISKESEVYANTGWIPLFKTNRAIDLNSQ